MGVAVVLAIVFFSLLYVNGKDRDAEEGHQVCAVALPDAAPRPVWRHCGLMYKCFYCADAKGMLYPVFEP